jgi:hypothetical protein
MSFWGGGIEVWLSSPTGAVQDAPMSFGRLFFLARPPRALFEAQGDFERERTPARVCVNYEISFDLLVIGPMFQSIYTLHYLAWAGE